MMGFVNEKKDHFNYQTIDHERKIVLKKLKSGLPTGPEEFGLYLDNEETKFWAYRNVDHYKNKNDYIKWRVVKLQIPKALKNKKADILEIIEEALDEYGFASSRDGIEKLEVTFEAQILED